MCIYKSIVFLCTSNENFENNFKILLIITSERIKYIAINLTKSVKLAY